MSPKVLAESDGDAMYRNPLVFEDLARYFSPDPFVLRFCGRYYMYATGETGVSVAVSSDLVTWKYLGVCFTQAERRGYWAPCVIYARGWFWMYVSHRPETSADPHDEIMVVARSTNPVGPFEQLGPLFDHFSIDAEVVRDEDSGKFWLFYSDNSQMGTSRFQTGTSILVDELVEMDRVAGRPIEVVSPSLQEEIYCRDRFGDGRDWYTIEGAAYLEFRNLSYLTYSGNSFESENYFVGYSRTCKDKWWKLLRRRSDLRSGNRLDKTDETDGSVSKFMWNKVPNNLTWNPLIAQNIHLQGTGHNSFTLAPNMIDPWIVYHGRDRARQLDPADECREMCIDAIRFDGDFLLTDAPTYNGQPNPLSANVTLPKTVLNCGAADLEESDFDSAGRLCSFPGRQSEGDEFFVVETWLNVDRSHFGGRAGLVIGKDEAKRWGVYVEVNTARHEVVLVYEFRGLQQVIARFFSEEIVSGKWLHLRVERIWEHIDAWLDGVRVCSSEVPMSIAGSVGIFSQYSTASFSGFGVTYHLDLWGDKLTRFTRLAEITPSAPLQVTSDGTLLSLSEHGISRVKSINSVRSAMRLRADLVFYSSQSHCIFTIMENVDKVAALQVEQKLNEQRLKYLEIIADCNQLNVVKSANFSIKRGGEENESRSFSNRALVIDERPVTRTIEFFFMERYLVVRYGKTVFHLRASEACDWNISTIFDETDFKSITLTKVGEII